WPSPGAAAKPSPSAAAIAFLLIPCMKSPSGFVVLSRPSGRPRNHSSTSRKIYLKCASMDAHRSSIRLLEGARQTEHVLGEVGEDDVCGDRRDELEPVLAELALDVVLGGEAKATVRLQADIRRFP